MLLFIVLLGPGSAVVWQWGQALPGDWPDLADLARRIESNIRDPVFSRCLSWGNAAEEEIPMIACSKCGKELEGKEGGDRVASISGSIMGDETIDSFYFCNNCGVYTIEGYHDRFMGDEEVSTRGPLSKEEGDEKVRWIKECSEPWDKKCRCPAHQAYFGGWLD